VSLPTRRGLRLLLLISSLDPDDGGPPDSMRTLSRAFALQGHSCEIVTLDAPDAAFLTGLDCPVTALGPGRLGKYRYEPRLREWLREHAHRFDVAVLNGLYQYMTLATWAEFRKLRKPYVVFTHGALDPWFKRRYPLKHFKKWLYWPWADYRILRDASRVLYTTDDERELAHQSFWLYRAREAVVGYGAPPPPAPNPSQLEAFFERFPGLRGTRMVLFLSRIHPKKGCDLLIDAFARVAHRDPRLRLVMAGPDTVGWQRDLEAQAARLGVVDRIVWTGHLAGDIKWGAFRAAEVFALTSHTENFGIAVVEALACRLPVLITNRVNIWREVEESKAGYVADDTPDGASRLMSQWLDSDATARAAMMNSAQELFFRSFEINAVARNILEAIAAAVDSTDRAS